MTWQARVTSIPTVCASFSAQAAICSATYAAPRGSVGSVNSATIRPRASAIAAASFVPPRSAAKQ